MKFKAEIDIMPHKELLDPQGKAVANSLHKLNFNGVTNVRVGKHITLHLEAEAKEAAEVQVEQACKKLLANLIMESYQFSITAE
jgi:phosphoribosylformylglycinamidine synthase